MLFVDRIEARAYSRVTEIVERVTIAVLNLFPEDLHEKVRITREKTEGHLQIPIVIVKAVLSGKRSCELVLNRLIEKLSSEDIGNIRRTLDQRLDERCVFFLRIDKQSAFLEEVQLARNPDIISLQIHLRQYPRCNRDAALVMLNERFND